MPASQPADSSPECVLPLPDGSTVAVSLEELEDLWEKLPALYQEGRERRLLSQMTLMDGTAFGLVAHPDPSALKQEREIVWTRPGALGISPAGVPMLQFREAPGRGIRQGFGLYSRPSARRESEEESTAKWHLVFSRIPNVPIQQCDWDDRVGWTRLAESLNSSSPQALLNHLLLQTDPESRSELDAISEEVKQPASLLLAAAEGLPDLIEEDYGGLLRESIAVRRVTAYDPDIFRYVELPGMMLATAQSQLELKDMDRALAKVGLVALRGFSTQGWGDIQRIAVKRGYRNQIGKLPSDVWQVIGTDTARMTNTHGNSVFTASWFRSAIGRNLGVVDAKPLPWNEWKSLKTSQNDSPLLRP